MPDGTLRVTGQLTQPGIFSYRNPNGTERKEYRPADEVFRKAALDTFAGSTLTINHPRAPGGGRLVTPSTFKSVTVGHVGDNVREDGGHVVADLYIKDENAIKAVRDGNIKHLSCGYQVDYDATPGTTPAGERYDGVQRNIRGNHVALLPVGVAPRGGEQCVLRLDSNGDEEFPGVGRNDADLKFGVDPETLKAQITALETELKSARTDAAALPAVKAELTKATARIAELGELLKPERLDAIADARASVVAVAKADGIDTAGKSTLAVKRAIVAKRTPDLKDRVDSMGEEAVDAVMAVYSSQPHPSLASAINVLGPSVRADDGAPDASRVDAVNPTKIPKAADLYTRSVEASRKRWQNNGDLAVGKVN